MLCVANIKSLTKYYDIFKRKKEAGEHNLKIATIFSYGVNEDDPDATGNYMFEEPPIGPPGSEQVNTHSRDKLEEYIGDYNLVHNTKFTTKDSQSFYNYYNDVARRVKSKEIDLLLVVNMFLTGFDSPSLNTLFVDKNLRYHGLIQAYSRQTGYLTNLNLRAISLSSETLRPRRTTRSHCSRIRTQSMKSSFSRLKTSFSQFNEGVKKLKAVAPTIDSVNDLETEKEH